MKLAIHPSSVALQSVSAFLGGAFVMALQGPIQSPGHQDAQAIPTCAKTIEDVTTGNCISANSTPTLGSLYPLSVDLNVTLAGDIGIGTTAPTAKLDVAGSTNVRGPITITNPQSIIDFLLQEEGDSSLVVSSAQGWANLTIAAGLSIIPQPANLVFAYNTPSGQQDVMTLRANNDDARLDFLRHSGTPAMSVGSGVTIGGLHDVFPFSSGFGTLRIVGDVTQTADGSGLIKYAAHVNGTAPSPLVTRSFDPCCSFCPATAARLSLGVYEISFSGGGGGCGGPGGERYYAATLGSSDGSAVPVGFVQVDAPATPGSQITVRTFDVSGAPADNQFYLAVY